MADKLGLQSLDVRGKFFGWVLTELLELTLIALRRVSTSLSRECGFGIVEIFVTKLGREAVSALDRVKDLFVEVVVQPAKSVDLKIWMRSVSLVKRAKTYFVLQELDLLALGVCGILMKL